MARDKQFKAKDKITHKMTRDGLVERNETQGTQQRVSMRGQEFRLDKAPVEQAGFHSRDTSTAGTRRRQGASPQAAPAPDSYSATGNPPQDAPGSPDSRSDTPPDFYAAAGISPEDAPRSPAPHGDTAPDFYAVAGISPEDAPRSSAPHGDIPPAFPQVSGRSHGPAPPPSSTRQGRAMSARMRGTESARGDPAGNRADSPDTAPFGSEPGAAPDFPDPPDLAPRPPDPAAGRLRGRPAATGRFTTTHHKPASAQHSRGRLRMEGDRQATGGKRTPQRGSLYSQKFMEKGQGATDPATGPPQPPDTAAFGSEPGDAPTFPAAPQTGEKPPERPSGRRLRMEGDRPAAAGDGRTTTHPKRTSAQQSYSEKLRREGDRPADTGERPGPGRQSSPAASRLQFSADELPPEPLGEKLTKARRKAERAEEKLAAAKEKLPTRKRVRLRTAIDPQTGEIRRGPRIGTEVKTRRQHLRGPVPLRPVKAAGGSALLFAHKKIREVEHENVGVEAAHKGVAATEYGLRYLNRRRKLQPYRKVSKLQKLSHKRNTQAAYQQLLHDNPELRKKHLSRMIQKQRIKRQYAKAYREAKRAGARLQRTKDVLAKAAKAVAGFVHRHPVAIGIAALLLLLVCVFSAMMSSCSSIAGGGMSAIFASSYTAEDPEMESAARAYTEWETDLLHQIQNVETDRPGYDEYRYNVGNIGHNPHELMAYLTAKYGSFTYGQVTGELWDLFGEQYTLDIWEEVEVRYRTETRYDENGDRYTVEVPYDYFILHIHLTSRSFSELVAARMDSDQREHFDRVIETGGNRQYVLSPFPFDWYPYISEYYGWRIHPITGEKDNHLGIDIAVAHGTQIHAAHGGTVTTATWHDRYGYYVVLDNGEGLQTKYAHCSTLLVSAGQTVERGDVIALVGSEGDSTGPHLHFEVIKDGEYRNPLFFAETVDDGARGPAPGTPGGPEFPENPGQPMGSGSVADLLEEAYKHLGKPYVFGASGPDYFDCSGYVSYVLNQSGVAGVGRLGAQALYNRTTPVRGSEAQAGDLVFFHSTYSTTTTVTHIGIYLGNGQMIHCGDPIQVESINTNYWQSHFYAFGRLN